MILCQNVPKRRIYITAKQWVSMNQIAKTLAKDDRKIFEQNPDVFRAVYDKLGDIVTDSYAEGVVIRVLRDQVIGMASTFRRDVV